MTTTTINTSSEKHPCFNIKARNQFGRVHLPVAAGCNIQCNYCDRKYDCVNESRPGVTSKLLTPAQSLLYIRRIKEVADQKIAVVGIAGPGDPFAQPEVTLETLRLIKAEYPDLLFCLSSNGLNVAPYVQELYEIGVSHLTITVNSTDPEILTKIYPWVRFKKKIYRGTKAAQVLLENQIKAIKLIKSKGITLKINTVVLPGINDHHLVELAAAMAKLGADVMNCIPLYPNTDTPFARLLPPSSQQIREIRKNIIQHLPIMSHCSRCRSDAAGLLGNDDPALTNLLRDVEHLSLTDSSRPYVAVASQEGFLVNLHLGEATQLYIFKENEDGYALVQVRETPSRGLGDLRWKNLATIMKDCRALLAGGVGPKPFQIISRAGIQIIEMTGLIEDGLEAVYKGKMLKSIKKRDLFKCGSECSGTGSGCA
ncbi:MAG: radical SAM protein [Candidatus Cyclobacteriaceae bacterium M3_2C_046]